ncbi:MAG: glycerol-3-phosphate 1-O-acyltransferase PlsY [Candidatus Omnitrophota bacterium]
MLYLIVFTLAAYLIGSIPTAYIFGKVLKGIDIREYGSGNVGATNVFRTVGKLPGIAVLILDAVKGTAAVVLLPMILKEIAPNAEILKYDYFYVSLGSAVIAGHIWTCFLKFKGGKGVATTAGVMGGLAPGLLGSCLIVWLIIFGIYRIVSLSSISSAVAMPIFSLIAGKSIEFILFTTLICIVGIYAHRANIRRLIQGTEKKIVNS